MANIDKKIYSEIQSYCELNKISDIDFFINKMIINGFNIEKYGILKSGVNSIEAPKPAPAEEIKITQLKKEDDDRYDELYDRL